MIGILQQVSKELYKQHVFHKINGEFILTRKSKVKICKPDVDIAYLLGVIAGDGAMITSKRKRGGYHYLLRIYSNGEKYLSYLNKIFNDFFLIEGKIFKDKRKKSTYYLEIKNATIFFYFVSLGSEIGKKKLKKIPKFALKNKNLLNYFAGLVDTDGSVSHKRIQFKQKSTLLLKEMVKHLKKFSMNPSKLKPNYTGNKLFYYIRFDNKLPLRLK
jgi:intein/homing endonuclease